MEWSVTCATCSIIFLTGLTGSFNGDCSSLNNPTLVLLLFIRKYSSLRCTVLSEWVRASVLPRWSIWTPQWAWLHRNSCASHSAAVAILLSRLSTHKLQLCRELEHSSVRLCVDVVNRLWEQPQMSPASDIKEEFHQGWLSGSCSSELDIFLKISRDYFSCHFMKLCVLEMKEKKCNPMTSSCCISWDGREEIFSNSYVLIYNCTHRCGNTDMVNWPYKYFQCCFVTCVRSTHCIYI